MSHDLNAIGVIEGFEHDGRPTFIVDLFADANVNNNSLQVVYGNPSMQASSDLLDVISGKNDIEILRSSMAKDYTDFKSWATDSTKHEKAADLCHPSLLYGRYLWTGFTLRKRWRVISGTQYKDPPGVNSTDTSKESLKAAVNGTEWIKESSDESQVDRLNGRIVIDEKLLSCSPETSNRSTNAELDALLQISTKSTTSGFDWARSFSTHLSHHIQLVRSVDWASTALGPMERWSSQLRQMCASDYGRC